MHEGALVPTSRGNGPVLRAASSASQRVLRLEAELAAVQDRFTAMATGLPDGFVLVDPAGRVEFANEAAGAIVECRPEDLVGRDFRELVDAGSLAASGPYLVAAEQERVGPFELDLDVPNQPPRVVSVTAGPWTNRVGERLGTWAHLRDVTEELAEQQQVMAQQETLIAAQAQVMILNEELMRSAHTDALTGLRNRLGLAEDVARLQAAGSRSRPECSALMIDIDLFKRFNDRYGHLAGDEALRSVAGAVRDALRTSDAAYRYGGEEMLVLLHGTSAPNARTAAERVLRAVETLAIPHLDNPTGGVVTVSIGVAVFDLSHTSVELALREADAALYAAKELGRNRWVALAA